ncbi:hypothetical protein WMY93_029617 [Mugilogobius chulae]|uniref:Prolactin receptor n=1 Tax=Mugilogobius chulae TaxID=88201 RepID=A0AAW0MKE2_9GOBI
MVEEKEFTVDDELSSNQKSPVSMCLPFKHSCNKLGAHLPDSLVAGLPPSSEKNTNTNDGYERLLRSGSEAQRPSTETKELFLWLTPGTHFSRDHQASDKSVKLTTSGKILKRDVTTPDSPLTKAESPAAETVR